jgi:replicative DNA helicase
MIMQNRVPADDPYVPGSNGEDFGAATPEPTAVGRVMLGEFLPGLLEQVLTGQPPPEYMFDRTPWGTLALRPGQITCIGGAPNCGKTALLLQMVTGALILNLSLRAVVACCEMAEEILTQRSLARISRVYLSRILKRERDEFFAERIESARPTLESLASRLMFLRRPFTMVDVRAACDEFQPNIVVLDYLQRIPADLTLVETRQQVNLTMTQVRTLADQGPAVLAAAALNRQSSSRAQSRADSDEDNVNDLAAFRDSSDIEYSVDDAFVLAKAAGNVVALHGEEYRPKKVVLRHVKSRNSLTMHVPLTFDGRLQEFTLRADDGDDEGPRVATPPPGRFGDRGRPRGWDIDTFADRTGGDDAPRFV